MKSSKKPISTRQRDGIQIDESTFVDRKDKSCGIVEELEFDPEIDVEIDTRFDPSP